MPTVLLAGVRPGLVAALRGRAGDLDVLTVEVDECLAALHDPGRAVVAVVLGSGAARPVTLAQSVYRADRSVPVLIVPDPEHRSEVEQALSLSPYVAGESRCLDPDLRDAELAEAIVGVAERARRRRSHRAVIERVREMTVVMPSTVTASQYLGQLLEHAPIGVLITDEHLVVRGWNPMATKIFGRRHDDAVGARFDALFPDVEHDRLAGVVAQVCDSDESVTVVVDRARSDGSAQHVELTAAAVEAGVPNLGCLVLVQDVTERISNQRDLAARAREANLAADVGLAVTGAAPLDRKLQRCAEAVVEHLDAAFARIWLLDEDQGVLVLRASAGLYTHLDGEHSRIPVGAYKIGRIASSRRPHLTNDVPNDPHVSDREWARREGMVAFAGYPLVVNDELVGVLALFARHELAGATLRALRSISDAVAVAIDQDRANRRVLDLLDREQAARAEAEAAADRHAHLARTLQQSLLPPSLPEIAGLEVAAAYHWAGDGSVIGGDFYDVFPIADGSWCAVIGDVTGKGVEAAALTALARYTLRAAALDAIGPAELLTTLNRALLGFDESDRFCTVAVAAVAPDEDTARLALAGHPPPVVLRGGSGGDEPLELVGEFRPPVGIFPDVSYTELAVALPVGDTLVLYTDGVTEARSPSGSFRPELLTEVLATLAGVCAPKVVEGLASAVLRFEGGVPRDDLAVLAVRRTE